MAKNTTAMSRVAQQRIRDWAAKPWTRFDILNSWRELKLRGNMDLVQMNSADQPGYVYALRDLTTVNPAHSKFSANEYFASSNSMSLDEALLAIDFAQAGRYAKHAPLSYVDQKIQDLRRMTNKDYGTW